MQRAKSKKLSDSAGLAHGFFGRGGGVSGGLYASLNCGAGSDDDPAAVIENKRRVQEALGATQMVTLAQVHSTRVITLSEPLAEKPQADALVTNRTALALGILTADCGPVLFADEKAGVIGAAHAGWKGATGGVLENTIAAMETLGAHKSRMVAVIGPTIAQRSYEVGEAFAQNLIAIDPRCQLFISDDFHFNLPGYICERLAQSGLQQCEDLAIDTYENHEDYFSYRRTTHRGEPDYGRQVSCICLR